MASPQRKPGFEVRESRWVSPQNLLGCGHALMRLCSKCHPLSPPRWQHHLDDRDLSPLRAGHRRALPGQRQPGHHPEAALQSGSRYCAHVPGCPQMPPLWVSRVRGVPVSPQRNTWIWTTGAGRTSMSSPVPSSCSSASCRSRSSPLGTLTSSSPPSVRDGDGDGDGDTGGGPCSSITAPHRVPSPCRDAGPSAEGTLHP